ncbi:hypothetical protein B005_5267 [Nocardiopsis alba ATCC BAA-2165]|uniref:Uncharacterized protein n=1 Tax=Nocardiopsis alba (strain ATCC BAA-2165 / BE74) TaxID=1205910 RepID=J7L9G5_NOCAA|nr:hypothetical protein B005_5267 [Nocardiopsis alba ATCC BAA-2165]
MVRVRARARAPIGIAVVRGRRWSRMGVPSLVLVAVSAPSKR